MSFYQYTRIYKYLRIEQLKPLTQTSKAMSSQLSILPEFELLDIIGKDAAKFLQGQLTCDVNKMTAEQFYLGAVCNPKGQMLANFVIAPIENGFRLRLPKNQAQNMIDSLKKYAVFFRAKMLIQDEYQVLAQLPSDSSEFNLDAFKLEQTPCSQTLYWPDGRIEQWATSSNAKNLNIFCQWQKADIKAGIYWLDVTEKEQWLPQMIHWQTLEGVSFTKGCYTGQEVIARLQHLGKNKKHLMRFYSEEPQQAGNEIYNELEKAVGVVLNFQDKLGLAMLNKKSDGLFTKNNTSIKQVYDKVVITTVS